MQEKKAISEEALDTVVGGANSPTPLVAQFAECSVCHEIIRVEAVALPLYGQCPKCGQQACFTKADNPLG